MQRVSLMSAFGRGRGARPPGMRVGNLDAQVRAALFGQGQSGYMLSFDRAEALYQESGGTTGQAASSGNPLGLVLDQRNALVRGAELASATYATPDAYDNTTTPTSASSFNVIGGTTASRSYLPLSGLVVGRLYELLFTIASVSAGSISAVARSVGNGGGSNISSSPSGGAGASLRLIFQATTTANSILWIGGSTVNFSVTGITVKEIPGSHFQQATTTARPTRQQDAQGYWYANADGTDDFLQSIAAVPYAGLNYLLSIAAVVLPSLPAGTIVIRESSAAYDGNVGASSLSSVVAAQWSYRGNLGSAQTAAIPMTPAGTKVNLIGQVGTNSLVRVKNGDVAGSSAVSSGSGSLANYIHYLFSRAGVSNFMAGRLYGVLDVASAVPFTAPQIALAQAWAFSKIGA